MAIWALFGWVASDVSSVLYPTFTPHMCVMSCAYRSSSFAVMLSSRILEHYEVISELTGGNMVIDR